MIDASNIQQATSAPHTETQPLDFHVDGNMHGDISIPGRLIVGRHGRLVGRVSAGELVVEGHLLGPILAGRLHVCADGVVEGEVHYGLLRVDAGGTIASHLHHAPDAVPPVPQAIRVPQAIITALASATARPAPTSTASPTAPSSSHAPVPAITKVAWTKTLGGELRRRGNDVRVRTAMIVAAGATMMGLAAFPISQPQAASLASIDMARKDSPRWRDWRIVRTPTVDKTAKKPLFADLKVVYWTTDRDMTLRRASYAWGIPRERLEALNPGVNPTADLPAGTVLRVYQHSDEQRTRSVGAPNLGFLAEGIPMPEAPYWKMPRARRRSFGTEYTVSTLVGVFQAYKKAYRNGPTPQLGDLSAYGGRKIAPHQSHQTGRDVDISFVRKSKWDRTNRFDTEKNWFLVRNLIDSGKVQAIFIDKDVQQWLRAEARKQLSDEEVARYFDVIDHESGHRHHMHVRFQCSPGNTFCISHSMPNQWSDSEEPGENQADPEAHADENVAAAASDTASGEALLAAARGQRS